MPFGANLRYWGNRDRELGGHKAFFAEPASVPPTGSIVWQTASRGGMDRKHQSHGQAIKDVYVWPLVPDAIAAFTKPRSALHLEGAKP